MLSRKVLQPIDNIQLTQTIIKKEAASVLKRLRKEWDEAADGESLLDTFSPVALLLWDVIQGLDLSQGDAMDILGFDLWAECNHLASKAENSIQDDANDWRPAFGDGQ